jgi:hypothetical protein
MRLTRRFQRLRKPLPIVWQNSRWAPRIVVRPTDARSRNTVRGHSQPGFAEGNQVYLGPFTLARFCARGPFTLHAASIVGNTQPSLGAPRTGLVALKTSSSTRAVRKRQRTGRTPRRWRAQSSPNARDGVLECAQPRLFILSAFIGDPALSGIDLAPGSRFTFYVSRFTNHVSRFTNHVSHFRSLPTS